MNEEIKEIKINKLNKSITFNNNGIGFSQFGIADEILDYITNLQQDNEMYAQLKDEYEEEIKDLQQENERLKEDYINVRNYIKMRNVSSEVEDKALLYNIELENINKKKYLDYKSRCEKAIGYGKTLILGEATFEERHIANKFVNILQNGSEKDEQKNTI